MGTLATFALPNVSIDNEEYPYGFPYYYGLYFVQLVNSGNTVLSTLYQGTSPSVARAADGTVTHSVSLPQTSCATTDKILACVDLMQRDITNRASQQAYSVAIGGTQIDACTATLTGFVSGGGSVFSSVVGQTFSGVLYSSGGGSQLLAPLVHNHLQNQGVV